MMFSSSRTSPALPRSPTAGGTILRRHARPPRAPLGCRPPSRRGPCYAPPSTRDGPSGVGSDPRQTGGGVVSNSRWTLPWLSIVGLLVVGASPAYAAGATDSRVSVGTPSGVTPQNHQNEPAVAIDAHNPDFLVAGSNDHGDQQPCPRTLAVEQGTCEVDNGVGVSGVY